MAGEYFSGLWGLKEAIECASRNQISHDIALDLVSNTWEQGGDLAVRELAREFGINYTPTELAYGFYNMGWTVTGEVYNTGLSPFMQQALSQQALEASVDTVNNKLTLQTARQVANKAGTKLFSAGAVETATTALAVVGAVATGAHLGWESYKEHPDFWTDLSESIFNASNAEDTPIEVLARAHAGGYTTAVKEQKMLKILQGLADNGAFDYRKYTSEITESGYQEVTFSEIYPIGEVCGLAWQKAKDLMPSCKVLEVRPDFQNSTYPNKYRALVVYADPNTLPSASVVSEAYDAHGERKFFTNISGYMVMAEVDTTTSTVTYNYYGRTTYSICSGKHYVDAVGTYSIGGLNVETELILADNELFPNTHASTNMMIAPNSSLSEILTQLKEKEPDWYDETFTMDTYNPETGEIESERYYPITIPWWDVINNPNKDPNYDPNTAQDGDIYPDTDPRAKPQGDEATKNNPKLYVDTPVPPAVPIVPPADTPTDPGGGAGGTSNALWSVYNPTLQELNDLGAYLWTNNIIELLEKFLQNPMDAIISLHKIYCQPENGPRQNIALGYLDSGVSSLTVSNQFKTIDCGSVNVPEYFKDARDYDTPYTVVECYLPFVGIVRLRTADILGGTVNIVYTVDVYSGACLCKIFVTKLGAKQLLYNFSGNCSMQIPLTGADRTRLLSGAVTGALTGAFAGAEVGAVAGAVMGAFMGGTSIDRTSGFSANAGCMGIKKPYLIVTRKYSYDAGFYNQYYGFPSNVTVSLGSCKGFTRVKSVHIENLLRATDNEKAEIETLLKEGVIIN